MAISTAISIAVSGLALNQKESEVVAGNITRSDQAGYTAKRLSIVDIQGLTGIVGIKTVVQRSMDDEIYKQLIDANADTSYLTTKQSYASQLDQLMGQPNGTGTLTGAFKDFSTALQALNTTPDGLLEQKAAIDNATALSSRLNEMSRQVQAMRSQAETGIADAVTQVNQLTASIAELNTKILAQNAAGQDTTNLQDTRDLNLKQLSSYLDIKTLADKNGTLTVFTGTGLTLVDAGVQTKLGFDAKGTIIPSSYYTTDPSTRGVGTITVESGNDKIDLIANQTIRSGSLAALIEARDTTLVQAQNQLDTFAANLASALSDTTVKGTAVTSGAQAGFDLDFSGVQPGNTLTLAYKDNSTGRTKTVSFVRVDDPSQTLTNASTPRSDDTVVPVNFSGTTASIVSQIQSALGTNFTVSATGSTLEILDDGASNKVDITSFDARTTATSLTGQTALPLFTDGPTKPYTGSFEGGSQFIGFSQRIAVNKAVADTPTNLINYTGTSLPADSTRPADLIARLKNTSFFVGAETGLVSGGNAFGSTLSDFADKVISHWGGVVNDVKTAKAAQDVIQQNLETRVKDTSAVSIDQELSRLIQIQAAYQANARVLTVAKEMINSLMQAT